MTRLDVRIPVISFSTCKKITHKNNKDEISTSFLSPLLQIPNCLIIVHLFVCINAREEVMTSLIALTLDEQTPKK